MCPHLCDVFLIFCFHKLCKVLFLDTFFQPLFCLLLLTRFRLSNLDGLTLI